MDQLVKPWRRLGLIFPGQGSHHVGMGRHLAGVSRAARDVFRRADEVLERRLSRLCFEGPEEELELTINQQPATFVVSCAWLAALRERWEALDERLETYLFAGHSMGEFTAAVAAGTLEFEEGLQLVAKRGVFMEEAGRRCPGGMASILGLSEERVLEICDEVSRLGLIGLATSNCEGQTVISGEIAPLERAMELAKAAGARRAVRLPISIASHSPLMETASLAMAELLDGMAIDDPERPVVGNINADLLKTGDAMRDELKGQLVAGVRWKRAVETMLESGVDMFVEVGPGNVLTRVVRRINYDVNSLAISDEETGLLSERFRQIEAASQ